MKVVQINATYGNGSTGGIVKDIQYQCLQSGIGCYVAYSTSTIPEDSIINGYQIGSPIDHKTHALLCRINGKQGYFSRLATRTLLRWLDELQPDVINIHNLHSNFINLPMLLNWIAKHDIPLVVTLHDCWYFTGGCFHFTSSKCSRWKEACGCCPRKLKDIPSFFDSSSKVLRDRRKLFIRIPNLRVVGVSQWTLEVAQQGIFKNTRCSVIYNGIDLNVFKPIIDAETISSIRHKYGIKNRFVILGPASKWLMPENRELLRRTLQLGEDYALVLYGCTHQQLIKEEAFQTVDDKTTQLIKIGFTKCQEELVEIYNMADVFINCTHEDTFSLINVESQACGTPVICYANTGAKETVNPEFGSLINTDDIDSIIESVVSLKSSCPVKSIDDELSRWVAVQFNKKYNYQEYIYLYQEMTRGDSIS